MSGITQQELLNYQESLIRYQFVIARLEEEYWIKKLKHIPELAALKAKETSDE